METNFNKLPQKCFHKPSLTSAPKAVKRERAFELSLPALVTGLDATGKKFEERTEIYTISAQEACFWIQSRLLIGSKVLLTMEVPRTLILERPLRLLLSGSVVFVRSEDARGRKQFVSARLDRNYKLFSNA